MAADADSLFEFKSSPFLMSIHVLEFGICDKGHKVHVKIVLL